MEFHSLTIIILIIHLIDGFDRRLSPDEIKAACDPSEYQVWNDVTVPSDFPLPLSKDITGYLFAPECAARYADADTWFVSWAADDLLYSGFTDGTVNNVSSGSGAGRPNSDTTTGYAMLMGSNPLNLTILSPGVFVSNTGPFFGRYPAANLHYNEVWYQSTYGLSDLRGACGNWCVQGPFNNFTHNSKRRDKKRGHGLMMVEFDIVCFTRINHHFRTSVYRSNE